MSDIGRAFAKKDKLERMWTELYLEKSSFESHWKTLSDYILPVRSRFTVTDANEGRRRNQFIIDSTPTLAVTTFKSGMMAGITSPARPWFRLTVPDRDLAEFGPVKTWLSEVTNRINAIFLKSNLYKVLPTLYGDLGVFGTASVMIEEDFKNVVRFFVFPIGSYMIANDNNYRANTFFREFQMTVRQVVDKFGEFDEKGNVLNWEIFSSYVKRQYQTEQMEQWITIRHSIYPNPDYDPNKLGSRYKRWASDYYERGQIGTSSGGPAFAGDLRGKFLRESGYDLFPVMSARWELTGEDIYATNSPGITALGDIKQLQVSEKLIMKAIDKMVDPPMLGPSSLRNIRHSILPSDITYFDETETSGKFRPVHEVNPRVDEMERKQEQVRQRILRTFYADIFLNLIGPEGRQRTAREIEEIHEEKLMGLGPILEQLNQDLLDPLIDNTFDIMLKQGLIPDPPEELEGEELKVEYISIMAQAQKAAGVSSIERTAKFASDLASATQNATVLDKIDLDQMVDEYGDAVGAPPKVIRSDDEVEEVRAIRQQAEQQARQAEAIERASKSAKDLSQADLDKDSLLKRLINVSQAGA